MQPNSLSVLKGMSLSQKSHRQKYFFKMSKMTENDRRTRIGSNFGTRMPTETYYTSKCSAE
jgi:hypothetical protein